VQLLPALPRALKSLYIQAVWRSVASLRIPP
jgi:hypothetical protein